MTTEHVSVPRELIDRAREQIERQRLAALEYGLIAVAEAHSYALHKIDAILSRATPSDVRCTTCDGTGDVHRADGEWLGECTACDAKKTSAPRVVTDRDIASWADRHDLSFGGSKVDARAAFEDAQSFTTSPPAARVPDDRNAMRAAALLCRAAINDDSYACSFQSMAQYRTALIAKIDGFIAELAAAPQPERKG